MESEEDAHPLKKKKKVSKGKAHVSPGVASGVSAKKKNTKVRGNEDQTDESPSLPGDVQPIVLHFEGLKNFWDDVCYRNFIAERSIDTEFFEKSGIMDLLKEQHMYRSVSDLAPYVTEVVLEFSVNLIQRYV